MTDDLSTRILDELVALRRSSEGVEAKQDARQKSFVGLDARFDGLEAKQDNLQKAFVGLETRFDGSEAKQDSLQKSFEGLETKFGGLEARQEDLHRYFGVIAEGLRSDIRQVAEGVSSVSERLDRYQPKPPRNSPRAAR